MKHSTNLKKTLAITVLAFCSTQLSAQDSSEEDLFDLSLEELMNVEIVSATKKSESLFEAPVSSYVISRDEIAQSGITSIPEALRLCPGVIVREMSNGNYDIHLRGLDNNARYTNTVDQQNKLTLVMIDSRPIFSYEQGGTFWEFLPVDLVDIERIEIVRGPAAPLFGPNAATGVINIITRQSQQKGLYTSGNAQVAPGQTTVGNLGLGYGFSDKLNLTLSGNYQNRERMDDQYYFFGAADFMGNVTPDRYSSDLNDIENNSVLYPNPELAQEKYGMNAYLNFKANENINLDLSAGIQEANVQKSYLSMILPTALTANGGNSKYINLASQVHGINARFSHNQGDYYISSENGSKVDYQTSDLVLNYQWEITDKLSIRPEFNYQSSDYLVAIFNNVVISSTAGSLQGDFRPFDKLRILAAGRMDKFNVLDKAYLSYQLATTYNITDKLLARVVQSRSYNSAFWAPTIFQASGEEIDLASVTLTELGLRAQVTNNLSLDLDIFRQLLQDQSMFMLTDFVINEDPMVPPTFLFGYLNLPMEATQYGLTISANFVASTKFQVKPFMTVQKTNVSEMPLAVNAMPISEFNPQNIYTGINTTNESTPAVYGGFDANYRISKKWHINMNSYFFGKHQLYHESFVNAGESTVDAGNIQSKMLLNSKISYRIVDQLKFYVNGRNLLNTESREYFGTDRTARTVLFGASYNF